MFIGIFACIAFCLVQTDAKFSYDLSQVPADPDVGLDMMELIQKRGYVAESHFVTTADGYILNMFRIPYGQNENTKILSLNSTRPAVILQHGLLDSSFTWINNYADESLGYILADEGFDVWFGNNRGNRYGRNHTSLNPNDGTLAFWDFSWDEMALQDVPAMVNYVTSFTGRTSVSWVGHSEGTIQMFAAASEVSNAYVQNAIQKINLFIALAPVAYVNHVKSPPLKILAEKLIVDDIYARGIYEIGKWDDELNTLAPKICQQIEYGCDIFLDVICGPSKNLNVSRIQVYVSGTPAGTSTKNMLHWEQGVLVNKFQKFDYGNADANAQHYDGSSTPPLYDLGSIPSSVKIALFAGGNDWLADPDDVAVLRQELPKNSVIYDVTTPDYAHLDYTWAYNANTVIYKDVVTLLHGVQ